MYLNHQLFGNFPLTNVKYLCMSTQRKAFVSTSPSGVRTSLCLWFVSTWVCTRPAVVWLWSVGSPLSCSTGKWRNNSASSDWTNGCWAELLPCHPEQHTQGECPQSRALQGAAARPPTLQSEQLVELALVPHCTCPLLVPCTCLSKVVRGWWYSHPLQVTCAK